MKLMLWLEFDCLVAPFLWNRQQLVSQPETFGSDLHRLDRNPSSGRRANGCQSFCSLADGWHLLLLLHRSCSQGSNRGAFCRASGGRDAINDCKLQEIDKANTRVWSPNWWCVVCPPPPHLLTLRNTLTSKKVQFPALFWTTLLSVVIDLRLVW